MIKWYLQTIIGLIIVFVVCYGLMWVLWKWIWLAIPIWVVAYLLRRKIGLVGSNENGIFDKLKKTL